MAVLADLRTALEAHRVLVGLAFCLLAGGVGLLISGAALGVAPIALTLFLAGFIDRRLVLLLAILIAPSMTAFGPTEVLRVGGHVFDIRLAMTGVLAGVLWLWLAASRPRLSGIGWIFAAYVGAVVALVSLNGIAPLLAVPVIGRAVVYLGVFAGAQAWLGTRAGVHALLIVAIAGLLVPALSGAVEWVTGGGLAAAGVQRVSGVYGSSPVGLALAMQIGVIALAGGALSEAVPRRVRSASGLILLVVMALVLVQTSSRLPFVTTAVTVAAFEAARRRWIGVVVVLFLAILLALSSEGLAARLGSTLGFVPGASATPSAPVDADDPTPSVDRGGASGAPVGAPTASPGDGPQRADDIGGGEASLRYRLFLWTVMTDEWAQSPWFGRGTGSFATLLEARSGLARVAPHNDYLYALVEGGIVLLVLYLAVQAAVVLGLLRLVASGVDARLPLVVAGVFVTTNVLNVINNPLFYVDLQLIIWAITGATLAPFVAVDRPSPSRAQGR